jgi:ATP-dependent Clp protease protease subunit
LLEDRIFMVNGVVETNMASNIVAQLLYLESEGDGDITMFVDSPGGSVTAGMSIIDTMNFVEPDVTTVIVGQGASMGSLISTSGAKGKRFMLPNARHMIHQPLGGFSGQATDAEIHVNELVRWKKVLTNIYVETTGHFFEKLAADMERDFFMTASESVDYGLADKVITSRKALSK